MITLIIILYILCIFGIAGFDSINRKCSESTIVNIVCYIIFAWLFPTMVLFAIGQYCAYLNYKIKYERNKYTI